MQVREVRADPIIIGVDRGREAINFNLMRQLLEQARKDISPLFGMDAASKLRESVREIQGYRYKPDAKDAVTLRWAVRYGR